MATIFPKFQKNVDFNPNTMSGKRPGTEFNPNNESSDGWGLKQHSGNTVPNYEFTFEGDSGGPYAYGVYVFDHEGRGKLKPLSWFKIKSTNL